MKEKNKNSFKSKKGITLIALVVTIVVLLILAAVSISMLGGENGIITQAIEAKEETEIASIKEEAELVKLGLNMEYLSNINNSETLKKNVLLSALNDHFINSTLQINRIVTSDEKYDIIVRNNLDIIVVKHGDDYLNDGEIELSYYYDETEISDDVLVEIYPEISGVKTYEEFAMEILQQTTDKGKLFVEADKLYRFGEDITEEAANITEFADWMKFCAKQGDIPEGIEISTIEELLNWINGGSDVSEEEKQFKSVDEMLIVMRYVKPLEYYEKYYYGIEIVCSNGENRLVDGLFNLVANFTIEKNGLYTFIATGPNGETGKLEIEINNIVPSINSVWAERTSNGLKITVYGEKIENYQFKIDDASFSPSQTSNEYNYAINYPEAKTTSSTTDPYIPRGFIHTEGTIDTGYVISDLPKEYTLTVKAIDSIGKEITITKNIKGSEFVWVPVDENTSTVYQPLTRKVNGIGIGNEEELGSAENATSVQYFINSVNLNGGFYVGRYEAGMPGNIAGDEPTRLVGEGSGGRNYPGVPIVREGVMPWNGINWSNAKESSELMYKISEDGIQSQLINGYAWATIVNWVIASGEKSKYQVNTDSTSFGNYYGSAYTFSGMYSIVEYAESRLVINSEVKNGKNIIKQKNGTVGYLLATGVLKERNSIKNICDMAGNLYEWTTALNGSSFRTVIGGGLRASTGATLLDQLATSAGPQYAGSTSKGFRVVLCK